MVPIIIFLFFTLFSITSSLHHHRRHLLHQPFFPVVPTSVPPSQSPSPQPLAHHQQLPKYPFSTTPPFTQQKPFFPSYHSPPPPPPPSVQSTFPANISSLLFPHPSSSTHRHVIILAVSLSLSSAAVISAVAAVFLFFRSRQRSHADKTSVSDSQRLFPPNLIPSDCDSTKATAHRNVSSSYQPSTSEFLYLGTLANSRSQEIPPDTRNVGLKIGVSLAKSPSGYQKLGSPELKPLPPLPKHNPSFTSGEMCFSKEEENVKCQPPEEEDDEEEQFFSPRGSSARKENRESPTPARIGSSSRRENFGSRSFNSRTASDPYSHSCSPTNSITSSFLSPGRNLSPNFVKSQFPENVNNVSISSSSFSSRSYSGDTQNSPDRASSSSRKNKQSPTRFVPSKLPPPPPPPPPPPRFWEIPTVARRSSGHSVLMAPQRADVIRSLGLSLANGRLDKNENGEKSEETPRPKLKPLHWDKVRASSDRAMVWDQLKSSSFQ